MRSALILLAAFTLSASGNPGAQAQALGPRNGAGLPPTDTGRVAVGHEAPDFTLRALDGSLVTLSALREGQKVVLVFYRGHW